MTEPTYPRDAEVETGAVLGIDNIALELPLAGLGSRVLAAAMDYVIVMVLLLIVTFLALGLVAAFDLGGGWGFALWLVAVFAVNWGYFAGFEVLARGRTPGKMAVRLRVVGRQGGTPSAGSLLVRNLLRDVDLFVGVPMMAADGLARRLGDRVAGTLVVHDRPPGTEVVLGRTPAGWGAREVAVAESFLRRSEEIQIGRRRHLAPQAGLARLHYFVALAGVAVEAIGIAGTEWGNPFFDPFRMIGAFIVAVGFVLFAIIVLGTREAAQRP